MVILVADALAKSMAALWAVKAVKLKDVQLDELKTLPPFGPSIVSQNRSACSFQVPWT
jgi:hypothetical protein